jgi:shikimate dehydrogenase
MRRMVNSATREIDWKMSGFGVTLPHKIEVMKYLTHIDEIAQKIGAVNTVKIDESGKLFGFNTDATGFIEPLKNSFGDLNNAKVAVLGAGGAARAVCYALTEAGVNVKIFARNVEKAKSLQNDFGIELEQLSNKSYTNFDIVVNTTPLGMNKGGFENESPAMAQQLEGVGLVYDLIYNPFETRLMQEASRVFIPTIGGLAMLVGQAMAQQKIWTGLDAPMKEMSAAALRKLSN